MTFKKSALAAAVLTVVAGNALAAPTALPTRLNVDPTYAVPGAPFWASEYQQSTGSVTTVNTGTFNSTETFGVTGPEDEDTVISTGTPEAVAGLPGIEQYSEVRKDTVTKTYNSSDTGLTDIATQASRTENTSSFYSANGLVTRTARIDTSVPYTDRLADFGTLTEANFEAYDLTKVEGAFEQSGSQKSILTQYKPDQVKESELHEELTSLNRYNDVQYDANGQPVLVDGKAAYVELKNQLTITHDKVDYNADDIDDSPDSIVLKSREADGKLSVESGEFTVESKEADYKYIDGDFVTYKVKPNGKVAVSNISESKLSQSGTYTEYDDVSQKDYELSLKASSSNQKTDIFDNFVSYDTKDDTSDLTVYKDGQHNLAWEGQLTSDESWKSRKLSEIDGQLNVDSVTTGTYNLNQQEAYYQPTHNAQGDNVEIIKDSFNQEIPYPSDYEIENGPQPQVLLASGFIGGGDTALQSYLYDSKFYEKTVDGSGNLVNELKKENYESLNYAANMQENIEVDRDLVRSSLRDKTVVGSKVVLSTNPQDEVISKFTRKFDGSPITLNDVNQWVDDNGNTHHYVVLGLDKNGQEIRTEVQITDAADPTALSLNATTNKTVIKNSTESVNYNEDEFYKSTDSKQKSLTTTYEDGSVEYKKSTADQTITVYNEGVVDKEWEGTRAGTQANQDVTFTDVGGVATAAQIDTSASSFTEKTTKYKPGQELEEETGRTFTYEYSGQDLVANTTTVDAYNSESNEKLYAEGSDKIRKETSSGSGSSTFTDLTTGDSETYATNGKFASTEFNTVTGLLATQEVLSTKSGERQESLSTTQAGVTTSKTVVRGYEDEQRSDESSTLKVYGSQTNVAGDGSQTVLAKSATTVVDKFGIEESNQLTQANTNITAAGAATTTTQQRIDDVSGIKLEKTVTLEGASTQRVAGTTQTSSTIISAGEISVDGVSITANGLNANNTVVSNVANGVADSDAANLGQVRSYYNDVSGRVNQLNTRVDDVEKTSYRGIAIALAAQQQIPNIGAGQFAVFGGVGHYEGESAGALGLASVFADGRTSVSAAVGFAGGNEVGGRVGVSYVFGGK